ncbi:MAG: CDP-diacylglycerol--glycerol-3-phosphate 3-phosphatidyltransferase [Ignavibacteriales bacterium]|nr:CDP-diacylglycerol--glycerol-3-phosphate 3-phosphatidyltransferase [Ignavibacteria bacterium]MCC6886849.1 CDP-diacylglycerol--glycerol-3-phosphate 3-phosphatidyltransferase [Ignavibacteriales bacterium]
MTYPNQLSLLRIILAPVFLVLYMIEGMFYKEIAIAVFFVAVLTDWYDGVIARRYGMTSRLGVFLDPLADKVLTSFAFLLFYIIGIMPLWMLIVIIVRDIGITLLRSLQEYKGKTLPTKFSAKVKTFIQMSYIFLILLILLMIELFPQSEIVKISEGFLNSDLNYVLLFGITIITLYTGLQYLFDLRKYSG